MAHKFNNNNRRNNNSSNRNQRPRQDNRPPLRFTPNGEKIHALLGHASRLVRTLAGRHAAGDLLHNTVRHRSYEEELRSRLQPDMSALSEELIHTLQLILGATGDENILNLWLQELTISHDDEADIPDDEHPSDTSETDNPDAGSPDHEGDAPSSSEVAASPDSETDD